jgi:hypothetical protein
MHVGGEWGSKKGLIFQWTLVKHDEKVTAVSIEIERDEHVGPHDEHTGASSASTTMPLAFLEAPLVLPSHPPSNVRLVSLPVLKPPC